MTRDLWSESLDRIRQKVNPQSFSTWFKPTRLLSREAGTLTLGVPNAMFAEWLRINYLGLISQTVREIDGQSWEVVFDYPSEQPAVRPAAVPAVSPNLMSEYTFETFVVGGANQFAHAAAVAVAQNPSQAYNPLFIYGGTGLGKTHLMQAIGNRLVRSGRFLRIKYISTEAFVNDLINSIRLDKMEEFRDRYRRMDVLLIDDVQFLSGKERTQEEFFHTFNALYEGSRQIVLTCDRAPREIATIEDRLRSRFEWGLLADIQPPDLETKVAILNKKAAAVAVELPSDVALYIAGKVKNVRELEGALTKAITYASVHHKPITIDLVKDTLKDIITIEPPVITVESIQKVVADYHNLKVSELKSKNNAKEVSFPRQIAMYLCKSLTDKSYPEIGKRFGGKHHSTVIYAFKKIETKRSREQDFDRLINTFAGMFQ